MTHTLRSKTLVFAAVLFVTLRPCAAQSGIRSTVLILSELPFQALLWMR